MKTDLQIEADASEVEAGFKSLEALLGDVSPIWGGFKKEFRQIEQEHFASVGGGKWQPLSPEYKAIKQEKYGSIPVLTATGRLYKSLTSETSDSIVKIDKNEISIGTSVPYAEAHQKGTRHLPQRKVIDLSASEQDRLMKAVKPHLLAHLKKSKLEIE